MANGRQAIITIDYDNQVIFKKERLGNISTIISARLKLEKEKKYKIIIESYKEGKYKFRRGNTLFALLFKDKFSGVVCMKAITKMFGEIDCRKRYAILVTEIKETKGKIF